MPAGKAGRASRAASRSAAEALIGQLGGALFGREGDLAGGVGGGGGLAGGERARPQFGDRRAGGQAGAGDHIADVQAALGEGADLRGVGLYAQVGVGGFGGCREGQGRAGVAAGGAGEDRRFGGDHPGGGGGDPGAHFEGAGEDRRGRAAAGDREAAVDGDRGAFAGAGGLSAQREGAAFGADHELLDLRLLGGEVGRAGGGDDFPGGGGGGFFGLGGGSRAQRAARERARAEPMRRLFTLPPSGSGLLACGAAWRGACRAPCPCASWRGPCASCGGGGGGASSYAPSSCGAWA